MIDDDALATVRTLLYPVEYERDPTSRKAIDWVIAEVIDRDETGLSRRGYLDHVRHVLAADDDLAAVLENDAHDDARIRAFLRSLVARLETPGERPG